MPEHSETTTTRLTAMLTPNYMLPDSVESGLLTVVEYAANRPQQGGIWIATTTTSQGDLEVWRVQVTKDATR